MTTPPIGLRGYQGSVCLQSIKMLVNEMSQNNLKTSLASSGRFYKIEDVADLLDVSTRTVRRWIDAGPLKVHRFGRSVRIAEADLRGFVATHRVV